MPLVLENGIVSPFMDALCSKAIHFSSVLYITAASQLFWFFQNKMFNGDFMGGLGELNNCKNKPKLSLVLSLTHIQVSRRGWIYLNTLQFMVEPILWHDGSERCYFWPLSGTMKASYSSLNKKLDILALTVGRGHDSCRGTTFCCGFHKQLTEYLVKKKTQIRGDSQAGFPTLV